MAGKGRWVNVGAVLAVPAVLMFFSGAFCGLARAQEQWLGYRSARSAYGYIGSTAGQKLCTQDKAPAGVAMPAFNEKEPLFALWKVDIGKTDGDGRFTLKGLCTGRASIQAYADGQIPRCSPNAALVKAGDKDVLIVASRQGQLPGALVHTEINPQSVMGKPLTTLETFGLAPAAKFAAGKPLALFFFDARQRPSRHQAEGLAAKAELWKKSGLVILMVIPGGQAGKASGDWFDAHHLPRVVASLPADEVLAQRCLARWGVTALPHIVLTDVSHTVIAEGISVERLEARLNASGDAAQPAQAATAEKPAPSPSGESQ